MHNEIKGLIINKIVIVLGWEQIQEKGQYFIQSAAILFPSPNHIHPHLKTSRFLKQPLTLNSLSPITPQITQPISLNYHLTSQSLNSFHKMTTTSSTQPDPAKNLNQFNKFLQNNTQFLNQRYAQHFTQQFPFVQLQTKAKIQIAIRFIYDVFSFEKYQKDQKMNATLRKSLRENILGFIKTQNNKEGRKFLPQDGIKLLKYCIENNEMFAVHYDKKEKKVQKIEKKQQQKEQEVNEANQEDLNKQKQDLAQDDQKPQQSNQNLPSQQIILNLSHLTQRSKQSHTQPIEHPPPQNNQFTTPSQQQKKHNQILKKQARIVFQFYCKQQLNAGGPNTTFDKISHESNTMTLGKFMAFANSTCILYTTKVQAYKPKHQKVLDKKTINEMFRQVSKAQKQIDFDQFFQLLKCLNQIDSTVYDKLNMGKSQTYNKILRKLKYLNTPFSMKGYLQDDSKFVLDERPYIPINTAHSGKFQSSLKQDIEQRRQKLRLLPHHPYPNPNQVKPADLMYQSQFRLSPRDDQLMQSKLKGPNGFLLNRKGQSKTTTDNKPQLSKIRLQNSRISFDHGHRLNQQINILQGLIVQDDDNDELFLKDYKIPKLGSNVGIKKKSIHSVSVIDKNNQQGRDLGRKFSGIKSERKNVVDQLKQRIIEVEKSERKQLTMSVDKRQKAGTSLGHNQRY